MRRLSLSALSERWRCGGKREGDGVTRGGEGGGGYEYVHAYVCEYMCSRITNLILQMDPKTWKQWNIWNAAAYIMPAVETRGGTDGNIVRADPYSPKARRREGKGGESGSRQGRAGERQNMLLARQEVARGGRRTVPVAFESRANPANKRSLVSSAKTIFPQD